MSVEVRVLFCSSIRNKLLPGLGLLLAIVVTLSWSGFDGLNAYRSLLRKVRRVNELPLATELGHRVSDLRVAALDQHGFDAFEGPTALNLPDTHFAQEEFRHKLTAVEEALEHYCEQLQQAELDDSPLGDREREQQTVDRMRAVLAELRAVSPDDWLTQASDASGLLPGRLHELQALVAQLPEYLQESIHSFPTEVRDHYRRRIVLAWMTSAATAILFGLLGWLTYAWIFRPLRVLIKGSRKVAGGRFDYRIRLDSRDEMGELAAAMNQMSQRFQTIHDDLDRQVQERTRQVVRHEQLASVGFLAAGVAHEINAPLGRIAACAKALQQRMDMRSRDSEPQRRATAAQLKQIQDEAFRCKEITQSLLEFSRMGSAERQAVNLTELVQGVIDMLGRVGRYQGKRIELDAAEQVVATVNAQQLRVVVLNLLCQSLDTLEAGGRTKVELRNNGDQLELVVADRGRGMTTTELNQLFEPCLRPARHGTGLGLAISARIVKDHGGAISVASLGPGQGTQFRVTLPLNSLHLQEPHHGCQIV